MRKAVVLFCFPLAFRFSLVSATFNVGRRLMTGDDAGTLWQGPRQVDGAGKRFAGSTQGVFDELQHDRQD